MTLTVDPIKLWAAPTSRARIEREFFEKTFRPFYRYQVSSIKLSRATYVEISFESKKRKASE